jgi:hypothetical protein
MYSPRSPDLVDDSDLQINKYGDISMIFGSSSFAGSKTSTKEPSESTVKIATLKPEAERISEIFPFLPSQLEDVISAVYNRNPFLLITMFSTIKKLAEQYRYVFDLSKSLSPFVAVRFISTRDSYFIFLFYQPQGFVSHVFCADGV